MDWPSLHLFLKRQRYGVVGSVASNGNPQSALMGIAITPDFSIIVDTLKTSRKYANLITDPRCSLVVGWTGEQTVQIEGIAEQPIGNELSRFLETYLEAWPDARGRMKWPNIAYFVVRPTWIRYSDYEENPALIWEATF